MAKYTKMQHLNVTCRVYSIICKNLNFLSRNVESYGGAFNFQLFCTIFFCVFSNVVDDNGDPHFEKIQTHVDRLDEEIRHIANNLVAACQNPQGGDKCERAFSIHKCWKITDPKVCRQIFTFQIHSNSILVSLSTALLLGLKYTIYFLWTRSQMI